MSYQPPPAPTDAGTQAPPPGSPRRLVRRTDDRVIAGVASGLADYLGIDPVIVRVLFVVLAFAGGGGILAYIALWTLTPEADGPAPFRDIEDRGIVFWIAIALLVIGGLALVGTIMPPLSGLVWPLLLIGAGIALWQSDRVRNPSSSFAASPPASATTHAPPPTTHDTPTPPAAPPAASAVAPTPTTEATQETASMSTDTTERITAPISSTEEPHGTTPPPGGATPPPPAPPAPSAPPPADGWAPTYRRRRSRLGRVTIALTLVTVGVLSALTQAGVLSLASSAIVAWALVVIGAGLLVSTFVGRARGLIWLGAFALVPLLLLTSVAETAGLRARDGVGDRLFRPISAETVDAEYRYGIGQVTLDLRDVAFDDQDVATSVRLGIGQLTVHVPSDVTVHLTYEVALGDIDVDRRSLGTGRRVAGTTIIDAGPGSPELDLEVAVGIGQIDIRRDR